MNFKFGRFFYLAISFVIGAFFFVFGAFSLILPWSSFLKNETSVFIFDNTLILSLFGLGFILIGISIVIYTLLKTRHRYIHIRIGSQAITLDENIVHQYLEVYWKEYFPNTPIPVSVTLKKHSLQIVADLPYLPLENQKKFLEQIKHDFSDLFGRTLGYPYDVDFIASFRPD